MSHFCHSIKNFIYYKSSFFGWIPGISRNFEIFYSRIRPHPSNRYYRWHKKVVPIFNPGMHLFHFTGFIEISVTWRISNFLKMNLGWNDKSLWDFRHKIKLLWLDIIPKWHILQFCGFKFWNIFANLHNTDKL